MKLSVFVFLATTLLLASASAQEGKYYMLKPHELKPGEVVVHKSFSNSQGGRMTITRGASVQKGTISITRSRSLERRLLGSGPKVQLQDKTLADQVTTITNIEGDQETETLSGALVGKTVFGFRDTIQRWRLFLKGQTANNEQASEIAELEAYENRRWFMESPVKIGQTWPIDPSFIRHLTERDLGRVKVNATMTFQSVQTIDNEPTAVLTFKIETLGSKTTTELGTTSGGTATAALKGTLHIALDTMLDKKITMTGTLSTIASEGTQSTLVILPVDMTVIKTLH